MTARAWTVGQRVVIAWSGWRATDGARVEPAVVKTVGRKWVTTDNGSRFHIETGAHDAGEYQSRGRLWPDEETYRQAAALGAWRAAALKKIRDFTFTPTDAQLDDIAFVMGWERKP